MQLLASVPAGNTDLDLCAVIGGTGQVELPTPAAHALLHALDAEMMAVPTVCGAAVKTGTVIGDVQLQFALAEGEHDFDSRRPAVQRCIAAWLTSSLATMSRSCSSGWSTGKGVPSTE